MGVQEEDWHKAEKSGKDQKQMQYKISSKIWQIVKICLNNTDF